MTTNDVIFLKDEASRRLWRRMAAACAVIAGIFCIFAATSLVVLMIQEKLHHPLTEMASGRITELRALLQTRPADAGLKDDLRQADARFRQSYWLHRTMSTRGAWLLLGGAVVLVAAIKTMRWLERPVPQREIVMRPDDSARDLGRAGWVVGGMGAAITALLLLGAWWSLEHPVIVAREEPAAAPEDPPTPEMLARQWPVFRGWDGIVPEPAVREWDGPSKKNILWSATVPLPGNSSPVVWNDRVMITGAHDAQRKVFAFDARNGQLLWQTAVGGPGPVPSVSEETGYATPSPVTDGMRAYALFPTGDAAAVDLATGRKVWERNLGRPANAYGYAASLALYADAAGTRVIVQWDVGTEEDARSSVMALDGRTGKTLWQTKRPVGGSWASPLVAHVAGDQFPWQLVTAANPWVIGYDAASGSELWRANVLGGDVAPSPAAATRDNITTVFASQEGISRAAIKATQARGDVTTTAVTWKKDDEGMPDIVSPVSDGEFVWTVIGSGVLFCFDAKHGGKVWEHEFGSSVHATPVLVGTGPSRELWITEARGITHRLAVGREFREVGACILGQQVNASLAFGNGRIFIRGKSHLFCLGPGAATAPGTAPGASSRGGEEK
jgi:outer membrane protein assembly factor BamB